MKSLMTCGLVMCLLLAGCGSPHAPQLKSYPTLAYTRVGRLLATVKAPYVVDLRSGSKRLVFIGCDHSYDVQDSQYSVIEQYFASCRPQIAFNEGGVLADSLHFPSKAIAVRQKGESSFLKYLCDSAGINMADGDVSDSLEFSITLKKYPKRICSYTMSWKGWSFPT